MKVRMNINKSKHHALLSVEQQNRLRQASEEGEERLDNVINQIMKESPEKFHTEETFQDRLFYDEPADAGGFVPRVDSIWKRVRRAGF